MTKCVETAVVNALERHGVHIRREQQQDAVVEIPGEAPAPQWHFWKQTGKMHKLPFAYVLTKDGTGEVAGQVRTPQQAYTRWWIPNNKRQICALRNVDFVDFSIRNQRKRYPKMFPAFSGRTLS